MKQGNMALCWNVPICPSLGWEKQVVVLGPFGRDFLHGPGEVSSKVVPAPPGLRTVCRSVGAT